MNKFDYKNLTPFKWFVLENFPFIEADFDALTEWQLFCKLGKEINKIIDSQNLVGEQAENLTNAFNNLKNYVDNYFENLDVQDEINNKLNEMAQSGELTEIIAQYLQLAGLLCFNTVEDLKKANNIVDGSFAMTYGYYTINDGGKGIYKIRTVTNQDIENNGNIIALNNTSLVAELITNQAILEQFGAKGDGITDDTVAIQNCITYAKTNNLLLTCSKNKTFIVNQILDISNLYVDFKKATFITTNEQLKYLFYINSTNKNYEIKNIKINSNNILDTAFLIDNARTININNIDIYNIKSYGIKVNNGYEIYIKNIFATSQIENSIGIELNTADCDISYVVMTNVHKCFRVTKGSNTFSHIHCWIGNSKLINNSSMFIFNLTSEGPIHMSNIYDDTFQYFINYTNNKTCFLNLDNFDVAYNPGIYTSDKNSSILFNVQTSQQTTYSNISNSFIKGLGTNIEEQNTQLTNIDYFYGTVSKTFFANVIRKREFKLTNVNSKITVMKNNIRKDNGVVEIDFLGKYNSNEVSGAIMNPFANIDYYLAPINPLTTYCEITDSQWDYTSVNTAYMYMNRDDGIIQIRLPKGTGEKFIHINKTYIVDQNK